MLSMEQLTGLKVRLNQLPLKMLEMMPLEHVKVEGEAALLQAQIVTQRAPLNKEADALQI